LRHDDTDDEVEDDGDDDDDHRVTDRLFLQVIS
jgi:hypothetical protein